MDFEQSGVVPYRRVNDRIEVLLITSLGGKRWIIPKGLLEPDLTAAGSAAMEAYEEAGVKGRIGDAEIGEYRYKKWGGTCRVKVYLLEVQEELDDWLESGQRERKWMSVDEAASIVHPEGLKKIVRNLADHIG